MVYFSYAVVDQFYLYNGIFLPCSLFWSLAVSLLLLHIYTHTHIYNCLALVPFVLLCLYSRWAPRFSAFNSSDKTHCSKYRPNSGYSRIFGLDRRPLEFRVLKFLTSTWVYRVKVKRPRKVPMSWKQNSGRIYITVETIYGKPCVSKYIMHVVLAQNRKPAAVYSRNERDREAAVKSKIMQIAARNREFGWFCAPD